MTERAGDHCVDGNQTLRHRPREGHAEQRSARDTIHCPDHAAGIRFEAKARCDDGRQGGGLRLVPLSLEGVDPRHHIGDMESAIGCGREIDGGLFLVLR